MENNCSFIIWNTDLTYVFFYFRFRHFVIEWLKFAIVFLFIVFIYSIEIFWILCIVCLIITIFFAICFTSILWVPLLLIWGPIGLLTFSILAFTRVSLHFDVFYLYMFICLVWRYGPRISYRNDWISYASANMETKNSLVLFLWSCRLVCLKSIE